MKKIIILLLFLFSSLYSMGQGFTYSYEDPCTLKTKEIYIPNPNGNIVLSYNGQIQSFSPNELLSGALQQWVEQVNSQNPSGPCSGIGLAQNTTINAIVAQNNIAVITTVLSTLSDISSMSSIGGSSIEGVIQVEEKTSSNDGKSDGKPKNKINGTTNTNGGSTTNTNQNTGTSQSGGNQNNGTGTGGGTNPQGGTNPNTTVTPTTGGQSSQSPVTPNTNNPTSGGVSNITGGVNSVRADAVEKNDKAEAAEESTTQSSSSTKNKVAAVKKGSLMMTGDIVTISSASGVDPTQVKVNTSIISSNTKNTFAKGILLNFTSTINNSNLTLFVSYRHKKSTTILANSSMINFDKDFFNTVSVMESYQFGKITGTVGVNLTMGNIGESKFQSLSTLAGVLGGFKLNKKMNMTTMFVMVYSPYVYYYEGLWHKSGFLAVPFVAADYKLTKKFKLNLSFSGINQINDQTLNYQVLIGAKALL
jgi:hypothetical protein